MAYKRVEERFTGVINAVSPLDQCWKKINLDVQIMVCYWLHDTQKFNFDHRTNIGVEDTHREYNEGQKTGFVTGPESKRGL